MSTMAHVAGPSGPGGNTAAHSWHGVHVSVGGRVAAT